MPELVAEPCRGFGRRLALGIARFAVEPPRRKGGTQLLRLPFDGGKIRVRPRRSGVRVADLRAGRSIERSRSVPHAAAFHVLGD